MKEQTYQEIKLSELTKSSTNPRKTFDRKSLRELADSIGEQGVLEPLIVRPVGEGFELVVGERRYRAAVMVDLATVPCIVRQMTDAEALEAQVIENSQREDLHPLEESGGYQALIDTGKYGEGTAAVDAIAARIGRSFSYVYSRLRLSSLTKRVKSEFLRGSIGLAHATVLMRLPAEFQNGCLDQCVFSSTYDHRKGAHVVDRTNRREDPMTVSQLRQYVSNIVESRLDRAPWKLDDGALLPMAGSCEACAKRSGCNASLFGDGDAPDKCLDRVCFNKKLAAHVSAVVASEEARHGEVVLLSELSGVSGAVCVHRVDVCKRTDDGATRAVFVSTYQTKTAGKRLWIKKRPEASSGGGTAELRDERRRGKVQKEFRRNLLAAMCDRAPVKCTHDMLLDSLEVAYTGLWHVARERVAALMGWDAAGGHTSVLFDDFRSTLKDKELSKFMTALAYAAIVETSAHSDPKEMKRSAVALGIDVGRIMKEARQQHPDRSKKKPAEQTKRTVAGQARGKKPTAVKKRKKPASVRAVKSRPKSKKKSATKRRKAGARL